MSFDNIDPKLAELASEVLRVMHTQKVGVNVATFEVITRREEYSLFQTIKNIVVNYMDEHEELRNMIVEQLRTDSSITSSFHPYKTYVSATAAALAEIEARAPVIR